MAGPGAAGADLVSRGAAMIQVTTKADIRGGVVVGHDGSDGVARRRCVERADGRAGSGSGCTWCARGRSPRRPVRRAPPGVTCPPMTDFEQAVRERGWRRGRRARACRRSARSPSHVAPRRRDQAAAPGGRERRAARGRVARRRRLPGSAGSARPPTRWMRYAPCPVVVVPVHGGPRAHGPRQQAGRETRGDRPTGARPAWLVLEPVRREGVPPCRLRQSNRSTLRCSRRASRHAVVGAASGVQVANALRTVLALADHRAELQRVAASQSARAAVIASGSAPAVRAARSGCRPRGPRGPSSRRRRRR